MVMFFDPKNHILATNWAQIGLIAENSHLEKVMMVFLGGN
jgi:hypothetical protein